MEQFSNIADVLSDIPAHDDKLDFEPYAKTVRDIVLNPNVATPLTIGIFGSWGSGKSSLMRMIDERLRPEIEHTIWFNAWVYNKEDALWRALITQVLYGVEKLYGSEPDVQQEVEGVLEQLYQATELTDLGSLSISAANLLDDKGTGSAQFSLTLLRGLKLLDSLQSKSGSGDNNGNAPEQTDDSLAGPEKLQELRKQVRRQMANLERGRITSLEEFRQKFSGLIEKYFANTGTPLVVFVDDLDRCLPEKAVEVLEAIKLFLDAPGCIFVLAIDQDVVERGIKLRYGELGIDNRKEQDENNGIGIDGRRYLEKIIQIPFNLPPISRDSIARFIAQEAPNLPNPECGQVFAIGLEPNPRQVKRSINIFSLLWSLSRHKSVISNLVSEVRLAKLVVLQQRFHTLYSLLSDSPNLIITWEDSFRHLLEENKNDPGFNWRERLAEHNTPGQTALSQPIISLLQEHNIELDDLVVLAELLTMHPNTEQFKGWNFSGLEADHVKPYIFLTSTSSTTGASQGTSSAVQGAVTTPPPGTDDGSPTSKGLAFEDIEQIDLPETTAFIETGLDSRRRAYILESTFGELARSSSFADVDAKKGVGILRNLANVGGRFYDQVFGAYDQKEFLADHLSTATTLSISGQIDESQIPWEMVYDEPYIDTPTMKGVPQDTSLDPNGFWGFKYIIERKSFVTVSTEIKVIDKPVVGIVLDHEAEKQALVEQAFKDQGNENAVDTKFLTSPDEFFASMASTLTPHLIAIHGRAGIDGEEAWIDFASSDQDLQNPRELLRVLIDYFNLDELKDLAFDLNIDFDYLGGQGKSSQSRELISHLERRGRLPELVQIIKEKRPNISFGTAPIRLNRLALERAVKEQKGGKKGNSLLYLNVNAGIARSTDWSHWLNLLESIGFGGVIVPLIPAHPNWSIDFMIQFIELYLQGGIGAGEALKDARTKFFADTGNPLGLSFAYFGQTDLQMKYT